MSTTPASADAELTLASVPQWLRTHSGDSIDLARVARSDSAGIALLLELTRRSRARGASLQILNAPQQIRALAQFFGVDSLLNFQ